MFYELLISLVRYFHFVICRPLRQLARKLAWTSNTRRSEFDHTSRAEVVKRYFFGIASKTLA